MIEYSTNLILYIYYGNFLSGVPSVKDVVFAHWREFGRNFYQRHDYEGVETEKGVAFFANLTSLVTGDAAPFNATEFRAIPGTEVSFIL
tara:strand:- start:310 stop:576 length:267 start_codon:yes stop_codon:yes gene_type:complete